MPSTPQGTERHLLYEHSGTRRFLPFADPTGAYVPRHAPAVGVAKRVFVGEMTAAKKRLTRRGLAL